MDSISLLRIQLEQAHDWLNATLGEPDEAQLHAAPPGSALPVGAAYVHAVITEDQMVAMLRGSEPLFATVWAGKNGLSEPMPTHGPNWSRYADWTRSVRIDLPTFRRYAEAVQRDALSYLYFIEPDDLDRELDIGAGKQSLGAVLGWLVIGHLHDLTGEISAARGLLGLKGYPA